MVTIIERLNTRTKTKLERREILETREDYWIMVLQTLKPRGLNAKLNYPQKYMTSRNKYEIKINIPVNLMLLKMGLARNMPGISVYLFA